MCLIALAIDCDRRFPLVVVCIFSTAAWAAVAWADAKW